MAGHRIEIEPHRKRVKVLFAGRTIADSKRAVRLRETGLPPVAYLPRDDVDANVLRPSDHRTHCPFKGDASYFSLEVDGQTVENAAWSYESAFEQARKIEGYLAFYPDKVDAIEEEEAA